MRIGELAALSAALLWTINGMLMERAGKEIAVSYLNIIRLSFALILISFFTFFSLGQFLPLSFDLKTWIYLGVSGIIGFYIGDYFMLTAIVSIGPRLSLLMMALSPPITMLIDYLVYSTKISYIQLFGIVLTIVGIVIVVMNKRDNTVVTKDKLKRGLFYAFLGALGQSVGLMFSKIGMGEANAFQATQVRIIIALIAMITVMITSGKTKHFPTTSQIIKQLPNLILAGLFGPSLGVGLSLLALQYTSAGVAATLTSTMPILVIPFSIFLYKEKLRFSEIFGTVVSVLGVAIIFIFK